MPGAQEIVEATLTGAPRVSLLTATNVIRHQAPDPATETLGQAGADTRWEEGMAWTAEPCATDWGYFLPCASNETYRRRMASADVEPLELMSWTPLGINTAVACTALHSSDDLEARATKKLERLTSYLIEAELATGAFATLAGADNKNMGDGDSIGTGLSPLEALAAMENFAATSIIGRALFHITPALAAFWMEAQVIRRDGNFVLTVTDQLVSIGAGYTEVAANSATASTAFVTPMLDVHLGPIEVVPVLAQKADIASSNDTLARAERFFGIVYPSDCGWAKLTVDHEDI